MSDAFFDAGEDKSLKHIALYFGVKKDGKKIAEGTLTEFKKKMTNEQFSSAERHPKKRYVITKLEDKNGKVKIELKEINIEKLKSGIIKELSDKINTTALLDDVLGDMSIHSLEELSARAVDKKGSVKSKEGCYKLVIGGKKGRPMQLMLRE